MANDMIIFFKRVFEFIKLLLLLWYVGGTYILLTKNVIYYGLFYTLKGVIQRKYFVTRLIFFSVVLNCFYIIYICVSHQTSISIPFQNWHQLAVQNANSKNNCLTFRISWSERPGYIFSKSIRMRVPNTFSSIHSNPYSEYNTKVFITSL